MFKVISAEFKKIFSKPGVFILAVLLTLILILGVFIYNPKVEEKSTVQFNGTDFMSIYQEFIGDDETDKSKGFKVQADTNLKNAVNNVKNYRILVGDNTYTQEEYIYILKTDLNKNIEDFMECQHLSNTEINESFLKSKQLKIKTSVATLNSAIISATTQASNGCYALITTEKNYDEYISLMKEIIAWSNITDVKKDNKGIENYVLEYKNKYEPKLNAIIKNFIYPTISNEFIETYTTNSDNSKLTTLNSRLNNILLEINESKKSVESDLNKNHSYASNMADYANKYISTVNTYVKLINYELISNAFKSISTIKQMNIKYLKDISEYNSNSFKVKYEYLFENNKTEDDYSNPLTIGTTSNNEINGYDYAYFVLRLFSFVVIMFAVMSACHSIAGETKDGSIRYLAIRPVSRTRILLGKLFSIIIIASILSIFSAIISLGVGFAVYGYSSTEILTIFNGCVPVVMHPIAMIAVYVCSLILEIVIYTVLAIMLSCLIKSDLLSVTIIIALILINTLLPVFINATNSWLTFYPFSHISLYSLFGSSIYSQANDLFSLILGSKVYINTNIILTAVIMICLIVIPLIISIKIFKKKEL